MKNPTNFKGSFNIMIVLLSFMFMNLQCTSEKEALVIPDLKNNTSEAISDIDDSRYYNQGLLFIKGFYFRAREDDYNDCVKSQGKCTQEYKAMSAAEKVARGVIPYPLPIPPLPCQPGMHCVELPSFLGDVMMLKGDQVQMALKIKKTGKVIAYNYPGKEISTNVKGYVLNAVKVVYPKFKGYAVMEIENLKTKEKYELDYYIK